MEKFKLSEKFIDKYKRKKPPFGFNGLGELVYMRTYSRIKADGKNERWWETVQRVVEGTYSMQKHHIESHQLGWNPWQGQKSAQEMYERIFNMKFLPPGRGLWAMGTAITEEKKLYAALNNCAFVSTKTLKEDYAKPFCFLMDASMLGVGVGFDTKGAGEIIVKGVNRDRNEEIYMIPDTREGWVESLRLLLESYFLGTAHVEFDYNQIRLEGEPIKGFGGVSSGPEPLKEVHEDIRNVLENNSGNPITITTIVDIMNLIGKCVVAGNVRRTAEIVFGEPDNEEYLDLKNYKVNPHRDQFGWTSNNSVFAELGMDYTDICKRINNNGEPGLAWLENMRHYSRMKNGGDNKDHRVAGGNPCLEQSLESYELCCLVETFPNNHDSLEDYQRTLKYAYLYAKTVTLGRTHWSDTNRVMLRNRRIGCSVSGVAQFITNCGLNELQNWLETGYDTIQEWDKQYSDWFAVPKSIKTTSVKPSGTVSLLAGATPGLHYPESRFYIRRVRLSNQSELVEPLKKAGYKLEPAFGSEDSTMVVEVPVDVGEGIRTAAELSIWEQFSLAAFMQRHWADNQVSCTATFNPETEADELPHVLNYFQYRLKGISLLPRHDYGAYKQMPYESINEQEYNKQVKKLSKLSFGVIKNEEAEIDKFCNNDSCEMPGEEIKST
ncbi:fused protease/ribonucleoside-triphosphate reductase [Candidatus Woesearchaeota archaeon]|jgi:ribonucleoside-triphosphate reductase (thioredoxin)|nr:fused protease/ribonucleoside-triphosphate reductase [Candidatus Woesearchaeota archaeon]MBT4733025.1 fused protease/ribonucleoside-triphosphate reductase [Candidatus Woesearchaeota archaeon]